MIRTISDHGIESALQCAMSRYEEVSHRPHLTICVEANDDRSVPRALVRERDDRSRHEGRCRKITRGRLVSNAREPDARLRHKNRRDDHEDDGKDHEQDRDAFVPPLMSVAWWRSRKDEKPSGSFPPAYEPKAFASHRGPECMSDRGPFLWVSTRAPPAGFTSPPPGGLCVCAFLFVTNGDRILLGKYADNPKWEELAGLDPGRYRTHGKGWTIPASHLKLGEDSRDAARRIGETMLGMPGAHYSEPRSEVDFYPSKEAPGEMHYDIWFFIDAAPPKTFELRVPPWYAQLQWHDPRALAATEYARGHQDVVERWLAKRPATPRAS